MPINMKGYSFTETQVAHICEIFYQLVRDWEDPFPTVPAPAPPPPAPVAGNATLIAGSATVPVAGLTSSNLLSLTRKTIGGLVGNLSYSVLVPGFLTITSSNVLDTSTVTWVVNA